jgi:hypothetical protein
VTKGGRRTGEDRELSSVCLNIQTGSADVSVGL